MAALPLLPLAAALVFRGRVTIKMAKPTTTMTTSPITRYITVILPPLEEVVGAGVVLLEGVGAGVVLLEGVGAGVLMVSNKS